MAENIDVTFRASRFNYAIEKLLLILLIFMPFAFGARHAWSEQVVITVSGLIVICFFLRQLYCKDVCFVRTWAYLSIAIFFCLTVFQLITLPMGIVSFLSPNTAALKHELLTDLPDANNLLKSTSLSFYKNATRHDLRLFFAVASIFVVVVNVFQQPYQIKRFLKNIAIIGSLVAFVAIAQNVFHNGKIYWFITAEGQCRAGPFVNHNHFGQFMNLSIGAAVAWLCISTYESLNAKERHLGSIVSYMMSRSAKPLWYVIVMIGLCAAAIFVSLTRGGMISLLIAASIMLLLFVGRTKLHGGGWVMVCAALFAFICILFTGFEAVYDRLATLKTFTGYDYRLQILKDLRACFTSFPIFGTGLGTHTVVYPMFQNIASTLLFTHVENEYAELFEESGLIGLLAFMSFAAIILSHFIRIIRHKNSAVHWAVYGLGFGLLAVLIHSLSDYGQHVPANAFLSLIFCALIVGLSKQCVSPVVPVHTGRKFIAARMAIPALAAVSAVLIWAFIGANNARLAEKNWKKVLEVEADLLAKNWQGAAWEYDDLIYYAGASTKYQPDKIEYLYSSGIYQWYAISKTRDTKIEDAVLPQEDMEVATNIIALLNSARLCCPTYGPLYSVIGQLEKFVLNDEKGSEKIRYGYRLAPNDPVACYIAGQLDVLEGNIEASTAKFEKAVMLKGELFNDVVNMYVRYMSTPHLALSAAGEDVGRLNYAASVLDEMNYADLAQTARNKVKKILQRQCSTPQAGAESFARLAIMHRKDGEIEEAIRCYRRALDRDYAQLQWRIGLAELLAETGQIQQAVDEAKICLRIKSQHKGAEEMLARLSVMPDLVK